MWTSGNFNEFALSRPNDSSEKNLAHFNNRSCPLDLQTSMFADTEGYAYIPCNIRIGLKQVLQYELFYKLPDYYPLIP